jgi:hypothetical protein
MKHARPDYDERIQDSAGLIPDDEPVLLIRGQDVLALVMLDLYIGHYAVLVGMEGADERVLDLLREQRARLIAWQDVHEPKIADLPA